MSELRPVKKKNLPSPVGPCLHTMRYHTDVQITQCRPLHTYSPTATTCTHTTTPHTQPHHTHTHTTHPHHPPTTLTHHTTHPPQTHPPHTHTHTPPTHTTHPPTHTHTSHQSIPHEPSPAHINGKAYLVNSIAPQSANVPGSDEHIWGRQQRDDLISPLHTR